MKTRFLIMFALLFSVSFLTQSSSAEQSEQPKALCEDENTVIVDGVCVPNPKPSDFRDLQTGETISNPEVIVIIQSLGAILIVLFIVIYAIKKRRK